MQMNTSELLHQGDQATPPPGHALLSVGLPTHFAFLAVMLCTCWLASNPNDLYVLLAVPAWALLGLYWFVRLIWYLTHRPRTTVSTLRSWCIGPVLFVLTIVLLFGHVPLRIRFEASRPAFERLVKDAHDGKPFNGPQWAGLYRVTSIVNNEDVTRSISILLDSHHGFQHVTQPKGQHFVFGYPLGEGWATYSHWPT